MNSKSNVACKSQCIHQNKFNIIPEDRVSQFVKGKQKHVTLEVRVANYFSVIRKANLFHNNVFVILSNKTANTVLYSLHFKN